MEPHPPPPSKKEEKIERKKNTTSKHAIFIHLSHLPFGVGRFLRLLSGGLRRGCVRCWIHPTRALVVVVVVMVVVIRLSTERITDSDTQRFCGGLTTAPQGFRQSHLFRLPATASKHVCLRTTASMHVRLPTTASMHVGLPTTASMHGGLPTTASTRVGLRTTAATHVRLPTAASMHV